MNNILLIDDQLAIRKFLKKILGRKNYTVFESKNSTEAFQILKSEDIELIILDVILENEIGYDICRSFKKDEGLNHIPIIFLTGSEESNALSLAYEAGGVDFIQKPVESGSLLMRVQSHFAQIEARRKLKKQHEELKAYQAKIIQDEKIAAVSRMVGGLSHELNNPLACIKSNYSGLKKYLTRIQQEIENVPVEYEDFHKRSKRHLSNCFDILEESSEEFSQLRSITDRLVTLDLPEGEEQSYSLNEAVQNALTLNSDALKKCELVLNLNKIPDIICHPASITETINGLLDNALRAVESSDDKKIEVSTEYNDEYIIIQIIDSGCGIPPEVLPKIWDPFFTTRDIGEGAGLGLSSIKNQMGALNGLTKVQTELGKGSIFELHFPHK